MMRMNPVMRRELRERLRGPRFAVSLTLGLASIFVITYLAYRSGTARVDGYIAPVNEPLAPSQIARVGRGVFDWTVFTTLLIVLVLAPATNASALAGERERKTMLALRSTPLRSSSIVLGKLGASVALLVLALVAIAPLFIICYLLGGVTVADVFGALGSILLVGVVITLVSIAISSATERVQVANLLAYGFVVLFSLGTIMVWLAAGGAGVAHDRPTQRILWGNPIVFTVVSSGEPAAIERAQEDLTFTPLVGLRDGVARALIASDRRVSMDDDLRRTFWVRSVLVLGGLGAASFVFATVRLRAPGRRMP